MTRDEQSDLTEMKLRLFGLDGQSGLYGDVQEIKLKLARWDGAITAVKLGAGLLGMGGIATILRAVIG